MTTTTTGSTLATLDDYVSAVAWSPDGDRLVAASLAGEVALLANGAVRPLPGHPGGVLGACWSADGTLATAGQDGFVRAHRGDESWSVELGGWVHALAWRPDSSLLAAGAGRDAVLIDTSGAVVVRHRAPATVASLTWVPGGRRVGVGHYGGITWLEPPGESPKKRFEWKGSILTLVASPDGRWVASGNQDNSVHVWRLWSGDDMQMTGYAAKIEHLAWHPTSRWLCVGDIGEVTCWDFAGRGPQGSRPKELKGHGRRITGLAFGGKRLASASADGTVRFWTLPSTKVERVVEVSEEISSICWHPSHRRLAVGGAQGRVVVVDVDG
jgi:WD40 repeat protein